ncbi:DUF5123 domain-containing protein [Pelobium manganitolerans]|uniref:DUF5123 domain-containing protein n=1 Tax=Pelobium manganitolerans TaxID=1842495 RepID=A0A419SBQ9_9SPHI|nr:DUF4957 domain-containing protein [Pelobium manganitolerans]RKD20103.1 DUF5123 domain-containing protein [Pelobium manganitolerans]
MTTKNIFIASVFMLTAIGFSSCKDELAEIKTLNVDRAFSPTDLKTAIINKTSVRLTWDKVRNAETYTVEFFANGDMDFSGSPFKVVEGVKFGDLPLTVRGFAGATSYSVRVKAIGEGIEDSKYVSATFSTDPEQIFLPVNQSKIETKSAVLNWTPGENATKIVLAPGDIEHLVTADEIAAGEATVTGLSGETFYTAKLMEGDNIRGTTTFTTLLDLSTAIQVSPSDNLVSLIAGASGGETFALLPGTYNINADVAITKSISIKGYKPSDKPIINGMVFRLKSTVGLKLQDLILDGTGNTSNNQTVVYDEDDLVNVYAPFIMQDCEVKNYVKGLYYVNKKALIESTTFKGNIIHDIVCDGGDFIDYRAGLSKTFLFENNTVYNSANTARDFFRMDSGGATNFPAATSNITITANTLFNVSNSNSKRILYIRLGKSAPITFTKNILANTDAYYTNQSSTEINAFENNNYFNAPNFTASDVKDAKNDASTSKTALDPGFLSPTTGVFTISNLTLINNGIGAARWR